MYKCCQRAMICRRVPKLSCVQSQPLISQKNSTASITKWAIPTLKTNSLETQRRSYQRMMPDLTCLSRWLSFSPKPWYLPVSSHFFELRLNGLNWLLSILSKSYDVGPSWELWCVTKFLAILQSLAFMKSKNYWRQSVWKRCWAGRGPRGRLRCRRVHQACAEWYQ